MKRALMAKGHLLSVTTCLVCANYVHMIAKYTITTVHFNWTVIDNYSLGNYLSQLAVPLICSNC